MSDTPLLELRNISKRFGGLQALDRVDFNLREGETHALVGENGAGKSTLMRILSGIYQPDEGEYVFDGKPVQFHNPVDALRAGIGMIHQELSVMPQLSVYIKDSGSGLNWRAIKSFTIRSCLNLAYKMTRS